MSLYSVLCEVSGSLSPNGGTSGNGNGKSPSSSSKPGYVYDEYSESWVYASPVEKYPIDYGYVPGKGPISQPFNPDDLGIVPFHKNEVEGAIETSKQLPPSYTYEGPLGGAGPFGLFAPKVGSAKYEDYVANQKVKEKEKYNAETIGIAPLVKNDNTTISEIGKQTEGTHLWDGFATAVKQGYTREPEDVNVFTKSLDDAKNAFTGIIPTAPNANLILIAGGVGILLLILIIR